MANNWRIEIATLRGDRNVHMTSDATGVSFERYVDGKVGSLAATLPAPNAESAMQLAALARDDAALTLSVYVSRGDEIWWGGILNDPETEISRDGDKVKISGRTFEGYPDDRTIFDPIAYTATEQLDIAVDLWSTLLEDEGDIGITLPGPPPSGVLRDLHVTLGDRRTFASVLNEMSKRVDGFEWMINCYRSGGNRVRELVLGFPRIGGGTGPTLTYPGNLLKFNRKPSTSRTGTRFWSVGAAPADVEGVEQPPIVSPQERVEEYLANGAVLIDRTSNYTDVTEQTTIDTRAAENRQLYGKPLTIHKGVTTVDAVGPAILGTVVRLRVSHPFYGRPSDGSPGYEATQRVIGMKVKPEERGSGSTVELVFEEIE